MTHDLEFQQEFAASPEELFPFFADAANLEAITPPALRFRILTPLPVVMDCGATIEYRLRLHGLPLRWRTRIAGWDPPHAFRDVQERGPWRLWDHLHTFTPLPTGGTRMTDSLRVRPPLSFLGGLAWPLLRREITGLFRFRADVLRDRFGPPAPPGPQGPVREANARPGMARALL